MNVLNAVTSRPWRSALLALVLTGALGGSALAATSELTIDPTAQLSPGKLHATLTGTVTCDPGQQAFLTGQIIQPKRATGSGSTSVACDGTPQPYSIDVSTGGGFPFPIPTSGVFKAGKASAQVSTTSCDPFFNCTSQYTDAVIRLTK